MPPARFLNAANLVSFSRLGLAILFVLVSDNRARLLLLILAGLSDFFDGWLARRSAAKSRSGPLVDAIFDRIFALTATCVLVATGELSIWFALILLSRDIMTAIGFIVSRIIPWLRRVPFKARIAGKVVTVMQYVTLVCALAVKPAVPVLVAVLAILSVLAIIDYTLALWRGRARSGAQ